MCFQPRRLVIAKRFHFHRRAQAVGENIAKFDAALRKLATHNEFGGTLKETLRDRFVCGLRLLTEHDLTYAKVLEIATGMEVADSSTLPWEPTKHINKVFFRRLREKDAKTVTVVEKQAISLANADLRIRIITLVAKRDTLRRSAEQHLKKCLPWRRDTQDLVVVKLLRWIELKES